MKKKILIAAVVLFFVASTSVFTLGIGAAFGLNGLGSGTPGGNFMISAKLDQLPFVLGFTYNLDTPFSIGATFDWHLVRQPLVDFVNIYAGPGFFFTYTNTPSGDDQLGLGLRVPVALYIFPVDFLELFLEIAPAFSFVPSPELDFHTAVGFRFWF